ncbi:MAG: hypothetical protein ACOCNS_03645 [Bacteroidales bacterium]
MIVYHATGNPCRLLPYRPAFGFASPWHNVARFGRMGRKAYLCLGQRGRARAFPLFAFLGANYLIWAKKLSYMTVKIISKPVKICSLIIFPKCFIVKNSLAFVEFFKMQISIALIIPKSLRRALLTIANA